MIGAIYSAVRDSAELDYKKAVHADEVKLRSRGLDIQQYNAESQRMNVNNYYELGKERNSLESRRVSQLELTNAMMGNNFDNAQAMQDLKSQMIEQQQQLLTQQQRAIEGTINTRDMTNIVTALAHSDYEAANKILVSNPVLKEKLKQHYGVTRVDGINFNNPEDVQALKQLGVDVSTLTPEAKEGLERKTFKSYTPDGKIQLHGVQELMKTINAEKFMTSSQLEEINNALNISKTVTNPNAMTPKTNYVSEKDLVSMAKAIATKGKMNYDEAYNALGDVIIQGGISDPKQALNEIALSDDERQAALSALATPLPLDKQKEALDVALKEADLKLKKLKEADLTDETIRKDVAYKHAEDLYTNKAIWETPKVDGQTLKLLETLQGKKPMDASTSEKLSRRVSIYTRGKKLLPELVNALTDTDFTDTLKLMLAEYNNGLLKSDKDLQKFKTAHQKALLAVYDYVNMISGQSMTDNELKRRLESSGYDKWKSGESIIEGLTNFVNSMEEDTESYIKSAKYRYPADVYKLSREFYKVKNSNLVEDYNPNKPPINSMFKQKDDKQVKSNSKSSASSRQINLDDYIME